MAQYYKASGNFSMISFVYFLATSLIIIPIAALAYTYLVWYIPFIYINFFITAGLGLLTGISISYLAVRLGKVRNTKIAILFGVLGGFIALYFSWVVWVDLVFNASDSYGTSRVGITVSNTKMDELIHLLTNPSILFELIGEINSVGTWGIRSATVSGTFLSIIWIIEALIVLVLSVIFPLGAAKKPFCELHNKWFEENTLPAFNFIEDYKQLIGNIETANTTSFDALEYVPNIEETSHSIFTLYSSDQGESYLSIENKFAKTNSKGEIDFDSNEFLEYAWIDTTLKNKLVNFNKEQ